MSQPMTNHTTRNVRHAKAVSMNGVSIYKQKGKIRMSFEDLLAMRFPDIPTHRKAYFNTEDFDALKNEIIQNQLMVKDEKVQGVNRFWGIEVKVDKDIPQGTVFVVGQDETLVRLPSGTLVKIEKRPFPFEPTLTIVS